MPRATIKRCTVHVLEVLLLRDLGCTACAVRATAMPSAAAILLPELLLRGFTSTHNEFVQ